MGSSVMPLNMTLMRLKKRAPQNFPLSSTVPYDISVLKNTVLAMIPMIVNCVVLKTYMNTLRFINSHSLENPALKSSMLEMPYFSFTRAAGWVRDLSQGTLSSPKRCCPTWKDLKDSEKSETETYLQAWMMSEYNLGFRYVQNIKKNKQHIN